VRCVSRFVATVRVQYHVEVFLLTSLPSHAAPLFFIPSLSPQIPLGEFCLHTKFTVFKRRACITVYNITRSHWTLGSRTPSPPSEFCFLAS
jgi:hypothetical protein